MIFLFGHGTGPYPEEQIQREQLVSGSLQYPMAGSGLREQQAAVREPEAAAAAEGEEGEAAAPAEPAEDEKSGE